MSNVQVGSVTFSQRMPFVLIAGPCVLESRDHAMMMAEQLVKICASQNVPLIFKTSFDKANRTSLKGERGLGKDEALRIFADIKSTFNVPILTDVHEANQCSDVASVVDVLQIPAFLCRQTDLLIAAGKTGAAVHVKKGQFLSPHEVMPIVEKIRSSGNERILLCERGNSFGYNTLVNDMRGLAIMSESTGVPIVFDATHSVQQPGGLGQKSGGDRRFAPVLARAALAVGVAGLFMEVHQDPESAPSDGPNMLPLDKLPAVLSMFKAIDAVSKQHPYQLDDFSTQTKRRVA